MGFSGFFCFKNSGFVFNERVKLYFYDKRVASHFFHNHRRFHETLTYKKPMDVYQESIKLNQEKKKAS